jgi:hypothetical protein
VREALELADETDDIGGQATVFMDLAEVLALSGEQDETGVRNFSRKGNIVAASATDEWVTVAPR